MDTICILGAPQESAVGAHFLEAARALGLKSYLIDFHRAFSQNPLLNKLGWWWDKRPLFLRRFSELVVDEVRKSGAQILLVTGITPLDERALQELKAWGVLTVNYLTDDPWNPYHKNRWFFQSLKQYDIIFSPRESNLNDLKQTTRAKVHYLPFAFSPKVHFRDPKATPTTDIFFAGGLDSDRAIFFESLAKAGFSLALYGGYWGRNPKLAPFARGMGSLAQLRHGVATSKVCLGLVRRANRDGHAMRSFEIPAMGGCLLVEDTKDHRKIFGPNESAVIYFSDEKDMVPKARRLVEDAALRERLAYEAHARVVTGNHTYTDRLKTILEKGAVTTLLRSHVS